MYVAVKLSEIPPVRDGKKEWTHRGPDIRRFLDSEDEAWEVIEDAPRQNVYSSFHNCIAASSFLRARVAVTARGNRIFLVRKDNEP